MSLEKSQIVILSLFPDALRGFLESSILRRAQLKDRVVLTARDLRAFGVGSHRVVDDSPYGGGQGMLFKPDVVDRALQSELDEIGGDRQRLKVIFTTPRGLAFSQTWIEDLSRWFVEKPSAPSAEKEAIRKIVILCGRYEGVDERVLQKWVDVEVSLGDFIMTGGEIAALALTDALVRLIPGVLGDERSSREDSFSNGLLEQPHFTKPRDFGTAEVPAVLLGGHHRDIERFKLRESLELTFALRPDLIEAHTGEGLPEWARELLGRLQKRLRARDPLA